MKKADKPELDRRIYKIAVRLKELRKAKGYKNHDTFAWDNDISRTNYQRMESGCNFTIESFLRILDIHKISLEEFFKGIK